MHLSILIATQNRARFLEQTLRALQPVAVPDGATVELLVVDNASQDDTAEVVRGTAFDRIAVRYVCERRRGKGHALNRGLHETRGDAILFLDDDVRPPADWISGLAGTLAAHGPCGVAGGVRLAPHLLRPWMTPLHRSWLAATEWLDASHPRGMVGANMAISRELLRHVPAFDPELGPGALGFGEEQLFASQLLAAGQRIVSRQDICVEHHFEPTRLLRSAWLETARKRGRAHAYRGHHWEHWSSRWVRPRLATAFSRLLAWRATHRRPPPAEGCSAAELNLEFEYALLRGHLRESRRPRNYDRHGAVKRRFEAAPPDPLGCTATPAPANE